jgi:ribosomal protein L12E/L44/L45/RPP1/RPP2
MTKGAVSTKPGGQFPWEGSNDDDDDDDDDEDDEEDEEDEEDDGVRGGS